MEAFQNPLALLLLLVLVILIVGYLVYRRRRAAHADVLPPPELSQPVDYTSLPVEEPQTLGDRFRAASTATKLLLLLLPLLLLIGVLVLSLTFSGGASEPTAQPVPPTTLSSVAARVTAANRILVQANTNLPDDTPVTAVLKESGQDFPWVNQDSALAKVSNGQVTMTLVRDAAAQTPRDGQEYTVTLVATQPDNSVLQSDPVVLEIPQSLQAAFFGAVTAGEPTAAPTAAAATEAPTAAAATEAPTAAAATEAPNPTATAVYTATVFNGGNIRAAANRDGEVLGQLHAGETVTLIEKSPDGAWFRLTAPEATGWSSVTLLTIDPTVVAAVPVAGASTPAATPAPGEVTATVAQGGNLRTAPSVQGEVLELVNTDDIVTLHGRNEAGTWLLVTAPTGTTGWANASLFTIKDGIGNLPVTDQVITPGTPAATNAATPAATTGPSPTLGPASLTAVVTNGGRIRSEPRVVDSPSNQVGTINAGEDVQLIAKSSDGRWYRITDIRGTNGWVSTSLLEITPEVAAKVPVEN